MVAAKVRDVILAEADVGDAVCEVARGDDAAVLLVEAVRIRPGHDDAQAVRNRCCVDRVDHEQQAALQQARVLGAQLEREAEHGLRLVNLEPCARLLAR